MIESIDQLHRTIRLENIPRRIVSLVPSQTELLFALGLENSVVGITKFCVHPHDWWLTKTRVGGTKQLDLVTIRALHPDLIIANKEENTYEDILEAEKICPVWISDVTTFEDALSMIQEIGKLTETVEHANALTEKIQHAFNQLKPLSPQKKTLYFIWKSPYYVAGKNTFIDTMLSACGLDNACTEDRYPDISSLKLDNPEVILLSTEPFPFKNKDIESIQAQYPASKVLLVNGEYFSWYGARLKDAPHYFQEIIHQLREK